MSLYKKIQSMKFALEDCEALFMSIRGDWSDPRTECRAGAKLAEEAYCLWPDNIMTEEELCALVSEAWKEYAMRSISQGVVLSADDEVAICIRALKQAGVLLVKEENGR